MNPKLVETFTILYSFKSVNFYNYNEKSLFCFSLVILLAEQ